MSAHSPSPLAPAPSASSGLMLPSSPGLETRTARALRDFRDAGALWQLCWTLSWLDIKLRYRGSLLGPFWLTLSTALMIGSMGFLYASLFHMDLHEYLPFLVLSIVLWGFIGTLVSEACTTFTSAEGMIRAVRMPFTLYAGRVVIRNMMILAHNIVVILVVDVVLSVQPGVISLLAIPAFALWLLLGLAISLTLGALCARFRDIPPIVGSVMQMAFFVSAVIWKPDQLKEQQYLLVYNPFYTVLEIVRGPLMGEVPSFGVYVSAGLSSVAIFAVSWIMFSRVRGRIAFWV